MPSVQDFNTEYLYGDDDKSAAVGNVTVVPVPFGIFIAVPLPSANVPPLALKLILYVVVSVASSHVIFISFI